MKIKYLILILSILFSSLSYAVTKDNQNIQTPSMSAASNSTAMPPIFSINIASGDSPDDFAPAIKVVAVLTLLTFGPAILLLMSSFTRIIIVLSFWDRH